MNTGVFKYDYRCHIDKVMGMSWGCFKQNVVSWNINRI